MKTILPVLVGVSLALAGASAGAQAQISEQTQVKLSIEPQSLRDALNEWAQQTGFQLVSEISGELVAPRVEGMLTPREGLERLLAGTPLTYEWLSERVVAVRNKTTRVLPAALQTREGESLKRPLRVAKLGGDGLRETWAAVSDQRTTPSHESRTVDQGPSVAVELEEIVVTGSHIRGTTVAAPSMTFTRADLDASGLLSTESVFETLPQNFSAFSFDGVAAPNSSALQAGNLEGAAGIDLRGLGPQSTLVLVNGERRAGAVQGRVVDVSAIPLSMVDRVDVLTGGHSAIYGSDAVAGVVNIVLRRSFDGAQTQVRYGDSKHDGGDEFQVSQILGKTFERGGIVFAYDYAKERPLDLLDTRLLVSPSVFGIIPEQFDLAPDRKRHSVLAAGHLEISNTVELFADAQYTSDENIAVREYSIGGFFDIDTRYVNSRDQYNASAGAHVRLSDTWELEANGNYSSSSTERHNTDIFGGFGGSTLFEDDASLSAFSTVVSGSLSFGALEPRLAAGVEVREEELRVKHDHVSEADDSRTVRSAFVEVLLPLLKRGDGASQRGLDLSIAGRFDDYTDFGDTTNPQLGLVWTLSDAVSLRGSYSTAFRAPSLLDLSDLTFLYIKDVVDPGTGGTTPALFIGGNNPGIRAEEATTWTVGFDFAPLPWLQVSTSYFDVSYDDRLDVPAFALADEDQILERSDRYGGLINRSATPAQLDALVASDSDGLIDNSTGTPFDPTAEHLSDVFPGLAVFDNRLSNIAVESVNGIDLRVLTAFQTDIGELSFGLNGTYTLDHQRSVTRASPAFGLLNDTGLPPDFRFRANAGWSSGAYAADIYVNYTDAYHDSLATPTAKIKAWTTADVTLTYRSASAAGVFAGMQLALSVVNAFNERPPEFLNSTLGLRYDAANANPLGRYMSLRIRKDW